MRRELPSWLPYATVAMAVALQAAFFAVDGRLPSDPARLVFTTPQLYFDLGFLYFVDMKHEKAAARYFEMASRFPDAPAVAKRFSAFAHKQAGNYALSRKLWEEICESTTNEAMKENALYALKTLEMEECVFLLNKAVDEYEERRGMRPAGLDDLVAAGLIRTLPGDPFGGRYFLFHGTGRVLSTTRVKTLAGGIAGRLQEKVDYYFEKTGTYPESLEVLQEEAPLRVVVLREVPRLVALLQTVLQREALRLPHTDQVPASANESRHQDCQ